MSTTEVTDTATLHMSDDGLEIFSFDTYEPETFQKFTPLAGRRYRMAVLPLKEGDGLTPMMVSARTHYHSSDRSAAPLYCFRCLSTKDHEAECCKHPEELGKATLKIAVPVIVYTTNNKGELLKQPKKEATLQVMVLSGLSINHFRDLNNTMTHCEEDFFVDAVKSGNFTNLAFSTTGPAYWLAWDQDDKLQEKSKEWLRTGKEVYQKRSQLRDVCASNKTEQEILRALATPKASSTSEDLGDLYDLS